MDAAKLSRLREDFYGPDPLLGDRALKAALHELGDRALAELLPKQSGVGATSVQIERRLAKLARAVGPSCVDQLVDIVRNGGWHPAGAAAAAFAGLHDHIDRAQPGLVALLKDDAVAIDAQRRAIEAVGYLGVHTLAFTIAEFAQFHESPPHAWAQPSEYYLGKFYYYVVQALVRMTARASDVDHISYCLRTLRDFVPVCDNVLGTGRVRPEDLRLVLRSFPSRAADPLIQTWLRSNSELLQGWSVDALGDFRLNRTVPTLLDAVQNPMLDDTIRRLAGISLSQFVDPSAASQLAKRMPEIADAPGASWAFASLYAHDVDWPSCDGLVDVVLGDSSNSSEIATHMAYALACRGDPRAEQCFERLNSTNGYIRGASAIACARYDAKRAARALEGRDEEANDSTEHVLILAALIHAGNTAKIDRLHEALTKHPWLPMLRPIWKREVLYAFFVAEGDESERGKLWCEAALERPERVLLETRRLLWRSRVPAPRSASATAPVEAGAPTHGALPSMPQSNTAADSAEHYDVFISHASEDKAAIAEPLYRALVAANLRVWFDGATLKLGDPLRGKIDEGLARCRYGVVILSPHFLRKEWPQAELEGLMARETVSGKKAILPIWHEITVQDLVKAAPMLAGRLACRSSEGLDAMVRKILDVLNDHSSTAASGTHDRRVASELNSQMNAPAPPPTTNFTQNVGSQTGKIINAATVTINLREE